MFGKKKKKVLLLDCYEQIRDLTRSTLESGGYSVTTASTVVEALKSLGEKNFDLIVSEVEISGKEGFSFYQQVKASKKTATIPFVFMTSYEEREVRKVMRKGDMLVSKPVKLSEFLKQIGKFMDGKNSEMPDKKQKHTTSPRAPKIPTPQTLPLDFAHSKKRKRKKSPISALPPEPPTKHFTDPQGMFHYKQVSTSFKNIFKAYNAGKSMKIPPINFPRLNLEWEYAILPESMPVRKAKAAPEEDILSELGVEDEILPEDEMIWDVEDEELEEVSKEAPELLQIQENMVEFSLPAQCRWYLLERSTNSVSSSFDADIAAEKIEESSHVVFSMASLCFQMLGEDFDVNYVAVETEKEHVFFINDEEKNSYAVAIANPK